MNERLDFSNFIHDILQAAFGEGPDTNIEPINLAGKYGSHEEFKKYLDIYSGKSMPDKIDSNLFSDKKTEEEKEIIEEENHSEKHTNKQIIPLTQEEKDAINRLLNPANEQITTLSTEEKGILQQVIANLKMDRKNERLPGPERAKVTGLIEEGKITQADQYIRVASSRLEQFRTVTEEAEMLKLLFPQKSEEITTVSDDDSLLTIKAVINGTSHSHNHKLPKNIPFPNSKDNISKLHEFCVNYSKSIGRGMLFHAIKQGNLPAARLLIEHGIDTMDRQVGENRENSLHTAAAMDKDDICQYLIERKPISEKQAYIDTPSAVGSETAAHKAITNNSVEAFKTLVTNKANHAIPDNTRKTWLHLAASDLALNGIMIRGGGKPEIFEFICKKFPSLIEERTNNEQSAFMMVFNAADPKDNKNNIGKRQIAVAMLARLIFMSDPATILADINTLAKEKAIRKEKSFGVDKSDSKQNISHSASKDGHETTDIVNRLIEMKGNDHTVDELITEAQKMVGNKEEEKTTGEATKKGNLARQGMAAAAICGKAFTSLFMACNPCKKKQQFSMPYATTQEGKKPVIIDTISNPKFTDKILIQQSQSAEKNQIISK
jgi:hypothetical protein